MIGPIDPRLPGVFSLALKKEGDWINSAESSFGFTTKSIEQTILNQPRVAAPLFSGKIDFEAPFFYELALSLAVERVSGFSPGARTEGLRAIFGELSRVASHLKTIAMISKTLGIYPAFHYLMRERERVLDLFELATGSRHSLNICQQGGMSTDITEGFIERVKVTAKEINSRLNETHSLLTENLSFKKRTKQKGVLTKETINELGLSGVIARSVGIETDLRTEQKQDVYIKNGWSISVCPRAIHSDVSDVYSRFFVWVSEIEESLNFLEKICIVIPLQDTTGADRFVAKEGSAQSEVETQRGKLKLSIQVPEDPSLGYETQWKTPSQSIVKSIDLSLRGMRDEDVFLVLQSLNFNVSEVDL